MRMDALLKIQNELKSLADPKQAQNLQRFFKTGKGEYAQGDVFYGIKVPVTRGIAKKHGKEVSLEEAEELLHSKIHEERLCALLILIQKFESKETAPAKQKELFDFYLANTKYINNWDLVDLSSHEIVGAYLFSRPKERNVLKKLAKSELLWERRIAMVSCYYFIYRKEFAEPIEVAETLLNDEQDLMHKAVGWMLREIGKRDLGLLEGFLKKHYKEMPRTMLRYSIEKFPEVKRKKYLKGLV